MQESRSSSVQGPSGTFNLFQEGDFVAFPILLRTAFTESLLLFFFVFLIALQSSALHIARSPCLRLLGVLVFSSLVCLWGRGGMKGVITGMYS